MTEAAPDSALPLVTLAVLAYNRREPLTITLGKLLHELDYPADRLEVIVVDNASTDGTEEMVRRDFPEVELIVSPDNEGIGGWNRAFDAGRGDWFLVLDDDCYVEGDALRRAVAAAEANRADLVSFAVRSTDPQRDFSDFYRTGVFAFWGCSVLISRRALVELGGFDTGLFIWVHELEFTMRLLDRGFTHLVLPDVSSMHMKDIPGYTAFSQGRNLRNFGYVAAKLLQPADAVVALAHLAVRSGLETAANPEMRGGTAQLVEGVRAGLRVRAPVRPAVSRLYRRNFLDFMSHLQFVRGPVERWRDRRDPGRPVAIEARKQAFWSGRPKLYPRTPAAFRVPERAR